MENLSQFQNNVFVGKILVLAGPPAVGKDTLTLKLEKLYSKFILFDKLKTGGGRRKTYRRISSEEFTRMSAAGSMVSEVRQHGSCYGVDREHLQALINADFVPVIHTAHESEWKALSAHDGFVGIILWAAPDVAHKRLLDRDGKNSATMAERLELWKYWTELRRNDFADSFPGAKAIVHTDTYDVDLTGELVFHILTDNQ